MRKSLLTLTALIAFAVPGIAQDKIKIGIVFVNSEYVLNPIEAVEYLQGAKVTLEAKEASYKGFYLNGVFLYKRDNFDAPTDTYAFGQKLSYRAGPIEPYAQVAFGFDTTYVNDRRFTREYSAGADINLGHIYLRPVEITWKRTEGFLSPSVQSFSAGAGVRF